jgi:hypothetical protein
MNEESASTNFDTYSAASRRPEAPSEVFVLCLGLIHGFL